MSEELKPCPYCGGTHLHFDIGIFRVSCGGDCMMKGPRKDNMKDAVEAWNALPRPLSWTKEPPTEPGEYWNRSKKYKTKSVVHVFEQYGKLYMFFPGNEVEDEISPDDEWAGPIQEPME